MNAIEVAQNSFNSWNRHDADEINAAYAEGGTYRTGFRPLARQQPCHNGRSGGFRQR